MGLFSKKEPCAICGGKVSGLFPWKIEGHYVCDDCHGVVDLPDGMEKALTLDSFRAYKAFRDENQKLKDIFTISETIDLGWFDTKIVFDYTNRLFCFDKHLAKTIFRGDELRTFSVLEDNNTVFEGTQEGLRRYESRIPEQVMAMQPRIEQLRAQREMREAIERLSKNDDDNNRRYRSDNIDVPEPFSQFNVELSFNHPYWDSMHFDMNAPNFDSDTPSVYDYLNAYNNDVEQVEKIVQAFMRIAFPGAGEIRAAQSAPAADTRASAPTDTAEELRKFKKLMDEGIITPQEFEAKKKQLLGL